MKNSSQASVAILAQAILAQGVVKASQKAPGTSALIVAPSLACAMSSSGGSKSARRRAAATAAAVGAPAAASTALMPTMRPTGDQSDSESSSQSQPAKLAKTAGAVAGDPPDDLVPADAVGGTATPVAPILSPEMQHLMRMLDDRFNKLETRMDSQGASITALSSGMAAMQQTFTGKLQEQDAKMEAERTQFQTNMDKLTQDLDKLRTAHLSAASASQTEATLPASSWAAAASQRHHGGARQAGAASRARSAPTIARLSDKHKVLVIGFPRVLPKAALLSHHEKVMKHFTEADPSNVVPTFFGNTGTMYSVGFDNGRDLGIFMRWFRTNRRICRWKDPRADPKQDDDHFLHDIIYKTPSSPEDRARGQALAPYHRFLAGHLHTSPIYTEKTTHRTRPDKGTVAIETEVDMWVPFSVPLEDRNNEVVIDAAVLKVFGFTVDQVRAFVRKTVTDEHVD
jgi:uncharacterized coiled-coil protein SlyX